MKIDLILIKCKKKNNYLQKIYKNKPKKIKTSKYIIYNLLKRNIANRKKIKLKKFNLRELNKKVKRFN